MRKIVLLLTLIGLLQADEDAVKVVFDLTAGKLQTFEKKVLKGIAAHKAHYEGSLKELDVAVVIHGGAYKFFLKDPGHSPFSKEKELVKAQPELEKRIAAMADTYEVKFLMCDSGRVSNKLQKKEIYDFVTMVPNAAIGLIDKQNEGFAYIPISD
ncbi:DsrE family protein [Sulfurimonas sp. HSL3-7]|uniref:DsrE family protein n=1 Tax=Sulfonitrofixus jiaomeiensis TaxID=3131938 RepID=UPI0031F88223